MKTSYNLFVLIVMIWTVSSCTTEVQTETTQDSENEITITPERDTLSPIPPLPEVVKEVTIIDGVINLESFQNQFNQSFDHQVDFGWRYITANHDEYAIDTNLIHTTVNKDFDLTSISAIAIEGDHFPVHFEGYAHSYQYVDGNYIYVTYVQQEISEALHFYYVNADFKVIKQGELASNGGDEGAWFYSFGEFSKDFSVYQQYYAAGEGLDTTDYSSDVIYFN